ncbi:ABC transporter substrate-binding protein [Deinococcus detaillensis]|nr:ABC transporter substrate-binding protein [Deinococcus detaillensis]
MKRIMLMLALGGTAFQMAAAQTTVEFWHSFGDAKRADWIKARADEYNKAHPSVTVVPSYKGGYNDSLQATILAARQNKAPALVQIFEVGSQLALDSGVFQPVSSVKNVDFSDYIKPVINYYTINGKVNSLPFNSSSPVLYFNKDMLTKAGLNPAAPPTTFGGIIKACDKLKVALPDTKCMSLALYGWFVEQWMSEQNADLFNNGNGRTARATATTLNGPAGKKIFQFFKDLQDKGYITNTGKLADTDGTNAIFSNQRAAFTINSTADLGNQIASAKTAGFQIGVGVLPIPDGTKRNGVVIGGASLWISKSITKPQADAALDFALYMTNTKNMADWHKLTGYYPVRNSSITSLRSQGWFSGSPLQITAFNQLLATKNNTASAGGLNGVAIQTRTIMEQGLQKVLGGQSVDATLAETASQINAALTDYNKNFK